MRLPLAFWRQRPLRRRNKSRLILGQHLTLERGIWYCDIPGDETKDGSPIAFTLPEEELFAAAFTHYLLVSRQRLLRGQR